MKKMRVTVDTSFFIINIYVRVNEIVKNIKSAKADVCQSSLIGLY